MTPEAPGTASAAAPGDGPAYVRVLRGSPDDVELAALVAGIVAVSGSQEADAPPAGASRWTDRGAGLRGAPRVTGPDAWRWSLR